MTVKVFRLDGNGKSDIFIIFRVAFLFSFGQKVEAKPTGLAGNLERHTQVYQVFIVTRFNAKQSSALKTKGA